MPHKKFENYHKLPFHLSKLISNFVYFLGVLREGCTYKSAWQAYSCTGTSHYDYRMLMIESMDPDTETSRLSPLALLGHDNSGNGYLDLINGPQDHGWCAGYTCQKRLSLFPALVALGNVPWFYVALLVCCFEDLYRLSGISAIFFLPHYWSGPHYRIWLFT